MPAKGKHRRPKANPIARGFVAAGTGGAVIAIPLMGATGAHAAGKSAPAVSPQSSVAAAAPAAPAAAKPAAAPATYSVVPGDYLAKIAEEHDVRGGWKKLYEDNRSAVGGDPSLIHPGLKLTVGGASKAKADRTDAPKQGKSDKREKPEKSEPRKPAEAPAKPSTEPAPKPEAQSADEAAKPAASGYTAPIDGAGISTSYRASGAMWSSGYHTGVDFQAASGTSVKSVGPGTVVSAGWAGSYGNEVVIQHNDGSYSQYAHLSSLSVSSGESVSGGQQIGLSGSTGNSTGPHLHFEIRTSPSYGSDVDPLAYLRQHGVSI
ncbi:peptidoglycan DD-metalloendopeptidase family protein [Streptomyces sp. NPDC051907]|uniref:peptidoglycan DD-metalloendopeptidase family protein n=1 Tax=Streptomyces sp. NPDC051907 TaxID=3155284 RepID=UPI003444D1FE